MAGAELNWLGELEKSVRQRDRRYPVYARIKDHIKDCIQSGEIAFQDRLPADRELASRLGLDRSTVARAYDELQLEGFVESAVGKGTFVTFKLDAFPSLSPGMKSDSIHIESEPRMNFQQNAGIIWEEKFSRFSETVSSFIGKQPVSITDSRNTISFAAGVPTMEFFPQADFENIVSELSREPNCREMFAYTETSGHPALREEVFKHLSAQGISAKEEELLILSGSQQGIDLVARTFIDGGDNVAVENPSYFWALCNFTAFGARTMPVSLSEDGLNLDLLESIFSRHRIKLIYIMPSFQNPTGTNLSLEKRRELLRLAEQYQVGVFEDNFVGDLNYGAESLSPLRGMEGGRESVIYQSTISKSLCPGLRIGWMLAPRDAMKRLVLSKRVSDLSTNTMSQLVLAEYLRRGLYRTHLQTVKEAYSARLDLMCRALTELLPNELRFHKPEGGMFIWARLPYGYSSRELLRFAEREGVLFSPGDLFFAGGDSEETFRLSFIQSNKEDIEEGTQRLAKAVRNYLADRRRKDKTESLRDLRTGPNVFV